MHRLRLTVAARRDLEAIQAIGLAEFGAGPARRYMAGFEARFALLRTHPRAGPERPDFGDLIRLLPYPPYRILYRVETDEVLIVRILHGARRPAPLDEVQ